MDWRTKKDDEFHTVLKEAIGDLEADFVSLKEKVLTESGEKEAIGDLIARVEKSIKIIKMNV